MKDKQLFLTRQESIAGNKILSCMFKYNLQGHYIWVSCIHSFNITKHGSTVYSSVWGSELFVFCTKWKKKTHCVLFIMALIEVN